MKNTRVTFEATGLFKTALKIVMINGTRAEHYIGVDSTNFSVLRNRDICIEMLESYIDEMQRVLSYLKYDCPLPGEEAPKPETPEPERRIEL